MCRYRCLGQLSYLPRSRISQVLVAASIVKNPAALVQLGKALFWDMQVGSDGVQSCASCHFSAGADARRRNQLSPGLHDTNYEGVSPDFPGDSVFGNSTVPFTANDPNTPKPPGPSEPAPSQLDVPGFPQFGPNHTLTADDFPLNAWFRPTELTPRGPGTDLLDEMANVSRDTNDVVSSQGVRHTLFSETKPGNAVDGGVAAPDVFTCRCRAIRAWTAEYGGSSREMRQPLSMPSSISTISGTDGRATSSMA